MRRRGEIERAASHTHTSHMRARGHEHATSHGREVPYSNGRAVVAGPVVNLWRWCLRSIVLQLRVGRRVAALLARGRHGADRWGGGPHRRRRAAAMRSSASDDTTSCKLTAATQRTTFDVPRRVCIVRYTGFAAKNKSARVGLRHVRTTPQTTPEQQKAGRIEQNQQHTTHRKDAQFEGPFLLRDVLRIADAQARPRRAPRAY